MPQSSLQRTLTCSNSAAVDYKIYYNCLMKLQLLHFAFLLNILNGGKLSIVVEFDVNFWSDVSVENDIAVISLRLLWEEE